MLDENWRKFIEKSRKEYCLIGQITCRALNGQKVVFNMRGFKHLIWKGKNPRTREEQKERLALLPLVVSILEKNSAISAYREVILGKSKAQFWAIREQRREMTLRIIVRRKNSGPLHFFSVMKE